MHSTPRSNTTRHYLGFILVTTIVILCFGCKKKVFRFEDVPSNKSGVEFENTITSTPELNILNYLYFYNGAGVASGDFNNDGLPDLYFVSNLGADKLYINKGELKFDELTYESGIKNDGPWSSGVSVVDINQDGLLDIYISKLGGFKAEYGHNQLWLNTGIKNNIPQFREAAAEYGLDINAMATHAAFFDYDLDNDLDIFLLNHSVHPNRSYGKGSVRQQVDSISGDRLLKNDGGKYVDVSSESGIFQGRIGYGLGLSIGDLNGDNYPDIYVGNDFFENDYLYVNNGDGTFTEASTTDPEILGHTTHFSMGNTMADINNDGLQDIISLDMLPEDLETYKTSAQEYNYQIYSNYLRNGYAPQYMQNAVHLNRGNGKAFSEIGYLSGLSSTEWSWSVDASDFDNDGLTDLYITNGILGATNDMDFINFIANETIQKNLADGIDESEQEFIDRIPQKLTSDYMFRNLGDGTFEDKTDEWVAQFPSFSHGALSVDLDLDGDLDLAINTVNLPARIIKNNGAELDEQNYIQIKLIGPEGNRNALGTKVMLNVNNTMQFKEYGSTRSYLSSSVNSLHFGLGDAKKVDSIRIVWPDKRTSLITDIDSNELIEINHSSSEIINLTSADSGCDLIKNPEDVFLHRDNSSVEFNREPLIPFAGSNVGPDFLVEDFNGDGLDDVFMTGAKGSPSELHLQNEDGGFDSVQTELFELDKLSEDVSAISADFNGDGLKDLAIASGGNEFERGINLKPRLYLNSETGFSKKENAFQDIYINASVLIHMDIDKDGDQDIIIGSNQKGFLFAESSNQFALINDGSGTFVNKTAEVAPALLNIQHITDLKVVDIDNDSNDDLVAVGFWEPVRIIRNSAGSLDNTMEIENSEGWWNTVEAFDLNNDGNIDLVAGNWGLNSRLSASPTEPVNLYLNDFDDNGKVDPILTYFYKGEETTFASKEDLAKQMPFINKDFLSFKEFSEASLSEIFSSQALKSAEIKSIKKLASSVFINNGNESFSMVDLPYFAQLSSVNSIDVRDYNNDGFSDLLLTGNYYEISTQLSRLDASHGELFINDQNGGFEFAECSDLDLKGVVRDIELLRIGEEDFLLIGRNNSFAEIYKISGSVE